MVEIINNNFAYAKYAGENMITFQFNLIELYSFAFSKKGEETAKKIYNQLLPAVIEIPDDVIFEAVKFKKLNSKKNLSYVDCLGYAYAKMKGIKFLTGDKAFKGMKNVEFVR